MSRMEPMWSLNTKIDGHQKLPRCLSQLGTTSKPITDWPLALQPSLHASSNPHLLVRKHRRRRRNNNFLMAGDPSQPGSLHDRNCWMTWLSVCIHWHYLDHFGSFCIYLVFLSIFMLTCWDLSISIFIHCSLSLLQCGTTYRWFNPGVLSPQVPNGRFWWPCVPGSLLIPDTMRTWLNSIYPNTRRAGNRNWSIRGPWQHG